MSSASRGHISRALSIVATAVMLCLVAAQASRADETVEACGFAPNYVFESVTVYGIEAQSTCPNGGFLLQQTSPLVEQGQDAIWQASAPGGLTITQATIPPNTLSSQYVNAGSKGDWGGEFYWDGGSSLIVPGEHSASFSFVSQKFGFLLVCGKNLCDSGGTGSIRVLGILLNVHENIGPTLVAPGGIWQSSGWIRGNWTLSFYGDSPSGLCSLTASLAGQALPGTSTTPDPALWHQCSAPSVNDPVYTANYPNGGDTLQIAGTDAAGVPVQVVKTIDIDNQQPTVALSGNSNAPSTAGTQYVTATAGAGPSGVRGISCDVDGGPEQWYPSVTAQVPVSGVGQHLIRCFSESNAADASGAYAVSTTETFSVSIGVPTVAGITFSQVVDALRCRRVTEHVKVPARWVVVRRGRHHVRIRRRAHLRAVKVTKCHDRTIRERRTVLVKVRRHGKQIMVKRVKTIRVVVLPHVVDQPTERVAYGQPTTVYGWLATYDGRALPGEPVQILAAPDNETGAFTPIATATTGADGQWSAVVPSGPSRVIEAAFGGGSGVEPSVSPVVQETVPAQVELIKVTPRRVAWGGTVHLVGQLNGGYLPPGGALVRLRIGYGRAYSTYGVREHVDGTGRFTTAYTFGAGDPAALRTFWFEIASLPMSNYPYAPASSRRITVVVGGHPRSAAAAH